MEAYVQQIVEWIQALSPFYIYIIFTLVAYFENIIPPIPGDVLVAFGGYLAAEQIINFVPVLIFTTVASVFGFMSMYAIGWYFGDRIEQERNRFWLMRFIDVKYFDKIRRWMSRWGQGVIIANRFLAGTRSAISLASGMSKTKVYPTVINSFISSILWNTILLLFGWIVHENWQIIGHYLNVYGWIILILIAIFIVGRVVYKRFRQSEEK
ncbi:MAG: DedA family protein [Balneolaceae bacterium]|nr:DedA family protein [Balneolaceae bacterium]